MATHRAAVLYSAGTLSVEEVSTKPPRANEVQIAPRATGICGTDQHYYQSGRNGIYEVTDPLVLGHEAAGEVVAVGSDVINVKVGDRVAIEPQQSCGACKHCRGGNYNLCEKMRFSGSASAKPPVQGSLQERINHPASLVYRLPETATYEEGAMIEPLSVAIHSVRKANIRAGHSVLIAGAGAIGLLCAAMAKLSGASKVTMLDVDDARLEFAKKEGLADSTCNTAKLSSQGVAPQDLPARVAEQTGLAVDVAFECTGVEACLNICIHGTGAGGRVVVVGLGKPLQTVMLGVAVIREIEVVGVWRYANTFPTAISLFEAGRIDVGRFITHTFDMSETEKALKLVVQKPPSLVKCIITNRV